MTTPNAGTGGQRGAQPVGGKKNKKKPLWLFALLAVLAIIALLLLLSRCGSSAEDTAGGAVASANSAAASEGTATAEGTATPEGTTAPGAPAATTAPTAAAPATTGAADPAATTSPLTANGTGLLPLTTAAPDGTLTAYVDQTATAAGVQVQSVPADEGFWVGTSETDRVWVQIIGDGESPYQVTVGDLVDFTGTVVAHDATFADTVELPEADGATQLTTQAAHVEVAQGGVALSQG